MKQKNASGKGSRKKTFADNRSTLFEDDSFLDDLNTDMNNILDTKLFDDDNAFQFDWDESLFSFDDSAFQFDWDESLFQFDTSAFQFDWDENDFPFLNDCEKEDNNDL